MSQRLPIDAHVVPPLSAQAVERVHIQTVIELHRDKADAKLWRERQRRLDAIASRVAYEEPIANAMENQP